MRFKKTDFKFEAVGNIVHSR